VKLSLRTARVGPPQQTCSTTGTAFTPPLSRAAADVLASCPSGPWYFAGHRDGEPFTAFTHGKAELDRMTPRGSVLGPALSAPDGGHADGAGGSAPPRHRGNTQSQGSWCGRCVSPSQLRRGEERRPYPDCCSRSFPASLLPSHPRQVDSSNAEKPFMKGYWYGQYTGSNSGQIVVELDDMGDHFHGHAYVYDNNTSLPSTFAIIKTADNANRTQFTAQLLPLHPDTQQTTNWQQISDRYSGVNMSQQADVTCEWSEEGIALAWRTNIGTHGSAHLPKSQVKQPSAYQPLPVTNWSEFIEYVKRLGHYRYMHRGQRHTLRLRTPFHRTGRADIQRFLVQDIQALQAYLSARTSHFYDLFAEGRCTTAPCQTQRCEPSGLKMPELRSLLFPGLDGACEDLRERFFGF